MASLWSAEAIKTLGEVDGRGSDVAASTERASESRHATPEASQASKDLLTTRNQILDACSTGDLAKFRELLASFQINADDSLPQGLPSTSEMLEAAVRNRQAPIMSLIFKAFPTAPVSYSVVSAALGHKDISIFSALLAQEPAILNRPMGDHQGPPLSFAVWGSDPTLANFLLDQGADPNLGGFGPLSNLCLAVQSQPVGLIQKMIEHGAHVDDAAAMKRAKELAREDVVNCLVRAGAKVE